MEFRPGVKETSKGDDADDDSEVKSRFEACLNDSVFGEFVALCRLKTEK